MGQRGATAVMRRRRTNESSLAYHFFVADGAPQTSHSGAAAFLRALRSTAASLRGLQIRASSIPSHGSLRYPRRLPRPSRILLLSVLLRSR